MGAEQERVFRIQISNTSEAHSQEDSKIVLDTWKILEPDIFPLFRQLESEQREQLNSRGYTETRRYKNSSYIYGIAQNNKYFLEYSE